MAIPLGGLVTGLTRALTGYTGGRMAGQQQQRTDQLAELERQRQARQDMLAQQLVQAQLGNYQSLAQDRQQKAAQETANRRATADAAARLRALPNFDPQLAAFSDEDLVQVMRTQATQTPRNLDPHDPAVLQRQMDAEFQQAQRLQNAGLGTQRQAGVPEREKATAGIDADRANQVVSALEARDHTIGARVAQKAANRRTIVAALGRRLAGLSGDAAEMEIERQIQQSMSGDELEYYIASKDYLGAVIPGYGGKNVTAREWTIQAPRFFSLGASTPQVTKNQAAARNQRVQRLYAEAGGAAPPPRAPALPPAPPQQQVGGRTITRTVDPSRFFRP